MADRSRKETVRRRWSPGPRLQSAPRRTEPSAPRLRRHLPRRSEHRRPRRDLFSTHGHEMRVGAAARCWTDRTRTARTPRERCGSRGVVYLVTSGRATSFTSKWSASITWSKWRRSPLDELLIGVVLGVDLGPRAQTASSTRAARSTRLAVNLSASVARSPCPRGGCRQSAGDRDPLDAHIRRVDRNGRSSARPACRSTHRACSPPWLVSSNRGPPRAATPSQARQIQLAGPVDEADTRRNREAALPAVVAEAICRRPGGERARRPSAPGWHRRAARERHLDTETGCASGTFRISRRCQASTTVRRQNDRPEL